MVVGVERPDELSPVQLLLLLKLSPNTPQYHQDCRKAPDLHLALQRRAELVVKREERSDWHHTTAVCPAQDQPGTGTRDCTPVPHSQPAWVHMVQQTEPSDILCRLMVNVQYCPQLSLEIWTI